MIGLMDCNNFFVSCERLFRPDLVGKPVAVLSSNDGCIVARSQEVKDMGVPMGMPLFQVRQLLDIDQITFFSSNFPLYRDISSRVMRVLADEVGPCEAYSIDESFFTLPSTITSDALLAVRAHVMQQTGIPVTIGVASTKTLAKAASKLGKKSGGISLLTSAAWAAVARTYLVEDIWNLGRATAKTLRTYDITTAEAFMAQDPRWIDAQFGIMGRRLQDELNGISIYQVGANSVELRQSLASTRSFAKPSTKRTELESAVAYHLTHVAEKLRNKKLAAGALLIELRPSRHGDFAYRGGSTLVALDTPSNATTDLLKVALRGFAELFESGVPYKKAGVTATLLVPESFIQPDLFAPPARQSTGQTIDMVTDVLNKRFGTGTIKPATIIDNSPKASSNMRSPHYTTAWKDIPTIKAN